MLEPKRFGLINALLANRADAPEPKLRRTLSPLTRGLLGLGGGLGTLSPFHVPQPRVRGSLDQIFAKSMHDRLVERLCSRLASALFSEIKVDLPGHVKPDRIVWTDTQHGHEPDASAYYALKQHIFEVETADSIGDEHTYEQCRLFAAYVRDRFAEFTPVVPISYGDAATSQLTYWGLRATVLEI